MSAKTTSDVSTWTESNSGTITPLNPLMSLAHYELKKHTKKFAVWNKQNLPKFFSMILSISTFIILGHVDIISEFYQPFIVQLTVSSCVIPSIFRFSTIFITVDLSAPMLDLLLVLFNLVHTVVAAVVLTLIMPESPNQGSMDSILIAGLMCLSLHIIISVADLITFMLATQLLQRSVTWTSLVNRSITKPVDYNT